MNTRREVARRVKEHLDNVGVPPKENQAPQKGNQVPMQDKTLAIPPHMMDVEIRLNFVILDQGMTNKEQSIDTQAQAMTAQENREVGPRVQ